MDGVRYILEVRADELRERRNDRMENKTLLQRILDSGYPKEDIFHHESDLYVYVTPTTTKIIKEWCVENDYSQDWHFHMFKDQITGRMMFDCAFQYYETEE